MKFLKSILLTGLFSLILCGTAGAQDFIFKYSDNVVMPMSMEMEQDHLSGSFYLSDDEAELRRLLEAGIIEYYGPDAEVRLMDAANDAGYARQRNYEFKITNSVGVVNNGTYDGRGVRVGIIDTGLAAEHPDIDYSKVVAKRNVTVDANEPEAEDVTDYWGHGTNVAGVIAAATDNETGLSSLAHGADLVIIKAFSGKPSGSSGESATTSVSVLLKAIDYAVNQGCEIINMSSGFPMNSGNKVAAQSMEVTINNAYQKGVIFVASAGNYSSERNDPNADSPLLYPAAFPNTISVASVDNTGNCSTFSYHNKMVDVTACGTGVSLLTAAGGTSTGSGTSFSAPFVASVAALVKQIEPQCDTDRFRALLAATAQDAGEPGRDTFYGFGIVNVGRLMDRLLGRRISVSEVSYDPETFTANAIITNSGFDSYRIKDIWKIISNTDGGSQSVVRTETVDLAPRSDVIVNRTSIHDISHMVWMADSLEPLCPVSDVKQN